MKPFIPYERINYRTIIILQTGHLMKLIMWKLNRLKREMNGGSRDNMGLSLEIASTLLPVVIVGGIAVFVIEE